MTDISFPHWNYKSDTALSKLIGDFIRHHRIGKDMTQIELAVEAGKSFDPETSRAGRDGIRGNSDKGFEGVGSIAGDGCIQGTGQHQSADCGPIRKAKAETSPR